MKTTILFYDVHGRDCPPDITCENCDLRKKAKNFKYGHIDAFYGKELENGNILIRSYWDYKERVPKGWDWSDINIGCDSCHTKAYVDWYKESKSHDNKEFYSRPVMQTIIYEYLPKHISCPADMTCNTCPLRRELAGLEEKYEIGYIVLSPDLLLVPCTYHNPKTNIWLGIQDRESDVKSGVCWACRHGKIR